MKKEVIIQENESSVELIQNFADPNLFDLLREEVAWGQNEIRVYGKLHQEPRLTAWYGPEYTYSSIHWPAAPLPDFLRELADELTTICGHPFNAVLLNYYRDGQDSMGWHRDNEKAIIGHTIASISLGATRDFKIRHRASKKTYTITLHSESLLLMTNLQEDYEHALPKRARINEPRINLTFRLLST